MKIKNWLNSNKNLLLLTVALSLFAFYLGLHSPFYLDDFTSIMESPWIRGGESIDPLLNAYGERALGYLTFWFNFHYMGTSPESFRLINILIHLATATLLFAFLYSIQNDNSNNYRKLVAYSGALIFLLHPLNTQAVTYIVQRLASMTGFWVLLSCYCFYLARAKKMVWLYLFAVLAFALGFFTKQNAIITPLLWYAIDRFAINRARPWRYDIVGLAGLCTVALVVAWLYWPTIDALTRETDDVTRFDYFLVQGPILWQYIGNFFFPANLRLEYGIYSNPYPLWLSVLAWTAHVIVVISAFLLRKRIWLVTLGVAWYYIAHLVESSVIPITDFAFEHRTYLPNIGLVIALMPLVRYLLKLPKQRGLYALIAVVLLLTATTAYRNYQWANPYVFYQNELSYNPDNQRVKNELARYALDNGKYELGLELFEEMLANGNVKLTESLLINLMVAYGNVEEWDKAKQYEQIALRNINRMHPSYRARIYLNQGIRLKETGQCEKAYDSFEQVQRLFNGEFSSLLFRTQCDLRTGNIERARKMVKELYRKRPSDPRVEEIVQQLSSSRP
ncbi:hypothetical protein LG288_02565 [Idiomarina seosinensis]|uniref:hypothetical protein n=1 Tax=Idiomarina seosinensis TaxID=281739 RepID=UPI00384EB9A0